jgi:Terpene cyclase DEP1
MERGATHPTQARAEGVRNTPLLLLLVAIWIAFVTFTIAVLIDYGLVGFIEAVVDNGAVTQVTIDLVLSIVIALGFIRVDARRMGLPYWPYLLATIASGSIGLIAYLIHRTWRGHASD